MARIRKHVTPWPERMEPGYTDHKDGKRGGLEDAFWTDEDELVDYVRIKKKKEKKPKKRGCPGNDFGPHVYIWQPMINQYSWWPEAGPDPFFAKHGYHRREEKVCCGCPKRDGYRYTEQFQRLIARKGWYTANYGD